MRFAALESATPKPGLREVSAQEVRASLLKQSEIALLDVREEAFHAEGHPLFAANLPLSRLELDAPLLLPRKTVPIVLLDDGEGYAAVAAQRLATLGYTNISLLKDGLQGWRDAGFEIFQDVNSPSKAFGELVEVRRDTPSLSAQEVKSLIDTHEDVLIVDARRYEEFQTMSIPTASSAPGGELVYRLYGLAQNPATRVIVNCAGRTRSIIGAQSLINAGLPNQVAALRNGTIGWKLARQTLDHGATRETQHPDSKAHQQAAAAARSVADAVGVHRTSFSYVAGWKNAAERTVYLFDVRTPGEYAAGHLPHFRNAPGGQLVQETDMFAPVRGARIVLSDTDGVRANMTASWLAQMNWEVYVVDDLTTQQFESHSDATEEAAAIPEIPSSSGISVDTLHGWLQQGSGIPRRIAVLDFSRSRDYRKGHIPGAFFALRSRLEEALHATERSGTYVVTASDDATARLAWRDLHARTEKPAYVLNGGASAWQQAGYTLDTVRANYASQPVDYYRRPYEGTDVSEAAMQAYLDWEAGLVEQLEGDSTHGFWVLQPDSVR